MGEAVLGALALMLIFEGLLPFISPSAWRSMFAQAMRLSDGQLRFLGLSSMVLGVLLALLFVG